LNLAISVKKVQFYNNAYLNFLFLWILDTKSAPMTTPIKPISHFRRQRYYFLMTYANKSVFFGKIGKIRHQNSRINLFIPNNFSIFAADFGEVAWR